LTPAKVASTKEKVPESKTQLPVEKVKRKSEKRLFEIYQDSTWVYLGYPAKQEATLSNTVKILVKFRDVARSNGLKIKVSSITKDVPESIKIKLKDKAQALSIKGLKLKLDKETTSTIGLYKGGANRTFGLSRLGPGTKKQVFEAVCAIFGSDFSIYFKAISSVSIGKAFVRLKQALRTILQVVFRRD